MIKNPNNINNRAQTPSRSMQKNSSDYLTFSKIMKKGKGGLCDRSSKNLSFTASYGNCAHNFVIHNLPIATFYESTDALAFTAVIKNILQRSRSVQPSEFLVSKLGPPPCSDNPYYLVNHNNELPNWYKTIKGSKSGKNPARIFFYDIWEKELPNYDWVRQLILPEADLNSLLSKPEDSLIGCAVDFYLPQAKLVIEIDGVQHQEEMHAQKDNQRDSLLRSSGKTVIRIPTAAFSDRHKLRECMNEIKTALEGSSTIQAMNKQLKNTSCETSNFYQYTEVMRIQLLLLTLIERNVICLNEEVWSFDVDSPLQPLFEIAAEDLFIWYQNLFVLKNLDFIKPELLFVKDKHSLVIRSFPDKRYDDESCDHIAIYTDYRDDLDYFTMSCEKSITYETTWELSSKHQEALEFFLRNLFGYSSFRDGQLKIISRILQKKKTIGILPTGSGKSICYFLACILQPTPNFAICPIVSLLKDQKKSLDNFKITRTDFIVGSLKSDKKEEILKSFEECRLMMVWISPERFANRAFRNCLETLADKTQIAYAVIDEVHCLSEWGHDFRVSYLMLISRIQRLCPKSVLVGLTATASQGVLSDLKKEFGVEGDAIRALSNLERKNLTMRVIKVDGLDHANEAFTERVQHFGTNNCGIVFAHKTKDYKESKGCNGLATTAKSFLPSEKVGVYHAKMSSKGKDETQDRFINDELCLLAATKAFGMGINKPNIRYTLHYGMPWSIEAFYQEAGRSGRDGKPAECEIIYNPENNKKLVMKLFHRDTTAEEIAELKGKLEADLSTIMFLWANSNKGISAEVDEVARLGKRLKNSDGNSPLIISQENPGDNVERALYRLRMLGVVDDWIVEHGQHYSTNYHVSLTVSEGADIWSEQSLREALLKNIRQYDPSFDLEPCNKEHAGTYYADKLINWVYEHIVYSRRQAMYNIMHLCDTYVDSKDFGEKIVDFLKITEKDVVLDAIVENPNNLDFWYDSFYDNALLEGAAVRNLLDIRGMQKIYAASSRYLESYPKIVGLEFVRAFSGLWDETLDASFLQDKFALCFEEVSGFKDNEKNEFISKTLEILAESKEKPRKESLCIFTEAALPYFPDKAGDIYEVCKDDYSLAYFLDNISTEIMTIMEDQNGKH